MSWYWQIHPYTIIGFLAFTLLTALGNALFIRRLRGPGSPLTQTPFVSILVPARNEALNIEQCVRSLLAQSYATFEVLVLDDHSTDATPFLLTEIQKKHPQLKILHGEALPAGWLGKHWACHQLAQAARGELLLFTDADTWHEPNALHDSVAVLVQERVDLLTALPHEEVLTWGEKLTVPVLAFAPFSFIPVFLSRWFRLSRFSITIGQFMLFRRPTYDAIGGYEAVRTHPLDDVKFGRLVLSHGFRWLLVDGTEHVHCRMYRDFRSSAAGLTRSLFAFFTHRVLPYVFAWTWIGIVFLEPIVILALYGLGFRPSFFPGWLAWIAVLEATLLFLVIFLRFRFPVYLALFYPLSISVLVWLAFHSLISTLRGTAGWKDRSLPNPRRRS